MEVERLPLTLRNCCSYVREHPRNVLFYDGFRVKEMVIFGSRRADGSHFCTISVLPQHHYLTLDWVLLRTKCAFPLCGHYRLSSHSKFYFKIVFVQLIWNVEKLSLGMGSPLHIKRRRNNGCKQHPDKPGLETQFKKVLVKVNHKITNKHLIYGWDMRILHHYMSNIGLFSSGCSEWLRGSPGPG